MSLRPDKSPGTAALLILAAACFAGLARADAVPWDVLEPGLEFGRFVLPAVDGGAAVNVLRIDPGRHELVLLNASANDDVPLTPRQWARSRGLVSVINASMFQEDLLTSVSLMRTGEHVNNSYQSRDKTILAFDPLADELPDVMIIDRECESFSDWKPRYGTLIQSIRMISCKGRNVWRAEGKRSSVSAVALDSSGRVLFIHSAHALSTHDLIDSLLVLPMDIVRAMYVEGGPQAQLYVESSGRIMEFSGKLNPLFGNTGGLAWPLPNVIGVRRKP